MLQHELKQRVIKKYQADTEHQVGEKRTSYTEYEVDASAQKTEEGRGDRRNVQGELHASEEP